MTELTVTQQLALELIEDYWREHGRSPSVKDIAESLGCASVNNAAEHIKALERKGAIEKRYGVTRDIYPIGLKDHVKAYFSEIKPFDIQDGEIINFSGFKMIKDGRYRARINDSGGVELYRW